MVRRKTKKVIGRKNTVIKAIPKPLFKLMVTIQTDMKKKNKRDVTLLEAGVELTKRYNKK